MHPLAPQQPIQLYGFSLSGHCHRVQLFLQLLDLPYDYIHVDLAGGEQRRPEFRAISPLGEVPVLRDGEVLLADSTAILVYLAAKYDAGGTWMPRDPVAAATVQRWLSNASGKIAYGPAAARMIKLFGAPLDHERAVSIAARMLDAMERELENRPFALGKQASIADIAAFSYVAQAPDGGVSLEPYPHIRAWLERVRALPRFVAMPAAPARQA